MGVCGACDTNPTTGGMLCKACRLRLNHHLGAMPATLKALDMIARRQAKAAPQQDTGGNNRAFPPDPIDWDAQTPYDQLCQWLQLADSDISARRGLHDAKDWVWHWTRVTGDLDVFTTLPAVADRLRQLDGLMREASRRLDPQPLRFAGTCPQCDHALYAKPTTRTITCDCGASIDVKAGRAVAETRLARMRITTTPAGAARFLRDELGADVTRRDVDKWRARGKLHAPDAGDGCREYLIGELIQCARQRT